MKQDRKSTRGVFSSRRLAVFQIESIVEFVSSFFFVRLICFSNESFEARGFCLCFFDSGKLVKESFPYPEHFV